MGVAGFSRLPAVPLFTGQELELVPAKGAPLVPAGLAPMGVARADAVHVARTANFLPLDLKTGRLAVSPSGGSPPGPATGGLSAAIAAAGAGDNVIVAAGGAGTFIRVFHLNYLTRGTVTVQIKSAATNLSGPYRHLGVGGVSFDAPGGFFPLVCGDNEDLILNLSGATEVDGFVIYTVGP